MVFKHVNKFQGILKKKKTFLLGITIVEEIGRFCPGLCVVEDFHKKEA